MNHKFNYKWFLKDGYPAKGIEKNNLNVFGMFICGGGSTMGYKLAGYNHLGGVEIDSKVAQTYQINHNPKYLFNEDIREFNKRSDLPNELFNLDILDGSPPCSTFSMAGSREKAWGKSKQFREGQEYQTLDDLVFVYCDTIIKLKPKIFILENVKGIIQGNAKVYSKKIVEKMVNAGYTVQIFCLNAASMGVPQKRERVFFIGHRNEFKFQKLKLEFNESNIYLSEIKDNTDIKYRRKIVDAGLKYWNEVKKGKSISTVHPKGSFFNHIKLNENDLSPSLTSESYRMLGWENGFCLSENELLKISTFPMDYNYPNKDKLNGNIDLGFLTGMSVPPVMTAQIAHQIYLQWLSKI